MSTINYLNIDGQRTHSLAAESKRVSYGIPLTIYNRMGPEAIYPTIFV